MGKTGKKGKERLDKYYRLAKDQGYRSRASFKLIQLNKKYDFLGKSKVLLDLCAAPGGWLQVASKYMPVSSTIIGVDLVPIKHIPRVVTFAEDITTQKCRSVLRKELKGQLVDTVLHDGAPNMGTSWLQDAFTQCELVIHACKLATDFLRPGGTFVSKVFRSSDYHSLLYVLNQLFGKVDATKPASSRNVSAEIFVVCQDFLAPKVIDPRLLDPKWVFKELENEAKSGPAVNIFHKKFGHKRNRDGYDTNGPLLYKSVSLSEFVKVANALPILAECHAITATTEDDKRFLQSPHTTNEILECLKDLKVLSKGEFKDILKWRTKMRELLRPDEAEREEVSSEDEEDDTEAVPAEDPNEKIDRELKEISERKAKAQRKLKRKENALKNKQRLRLQLKMTTKDPAPIDFEKDIDLFNLSSLRSKDALGTLLGESKAAIHNDNDEAPELEGHDEDDVYAQNSDDSDDIVIDEEYDATEAMAEQLDDMWEEFQERKGRLGKRLRREARDAKEAIEEGGEEGEGGEDTNEGETGAGLIVAPKISQSSKAAMWFSQKQFQELEDDDVNDADEVFRMAEAFRNSQKKKPLSGDSNADAATTTADVGGDVEEDPSFGLVEGEVFNAEVNDEEENEDNNNDAADELNVKTAASNSSSDDEEGIGKVSVLTKRQSKITDKAETLAIAKKLKDPKMRRQLIDGSFNRYAFHDASLPEWFNIDEKTHSRPNLPVTKEEVSEMKKQFDAINNRTIKKVAEAKARKKRQLVRSMNRIKEKAEGILKNSEIAGKDKMKEIEKLYKSKHTKRKISKTYVVAQRPGVASTIKKEHKKGTETRTKLVDKRLKSDKRGKKAQQKRKR